MTLKDRRGHAKQSGSRCGRRRRPVPLPEMGDERDAGFKKVFFSMADACCLVAIPLLVEGQEVQRLAWLTGCTGCGLESPSPICTMISAMAAASFPAMDAVWK